MPRYQQHNWDYTQRAIEGFGEAYAGRHIIGRDTAIKNGVYLVAAGNHAHGEAIVVDPSSHPAEYDRYYQKIMRAARGHDKQPSKSKILQSIYNTVRTEMHYSIRNVDKSDTTGFRRRLGERGRLKGDRSAAPRPWC